MRRPRTVDRLVFGLPSISSERLWCETCQEPTLRKWNACVHCGEKVDLTKPKRLPPITRASRPLRDPVTGRISAVVHRPVFVREDIAEVLGKDCE